MSEAKSKATQAESASAPATWLAGACSAEDTTGADARVAQRAVGRARCPQCAGCGRYRAMFPWGWELVVCECQGTGKRAQARKRDASVPANTQAQTRHD